LEFLSRVRYRSLVCFYPLPNNLVCVASAIAGNPPRGSPAHAGNVFLDAFEFLHVDSSCRDTGDSGHAGCADGASVRCRHHKDPGLVASFSRHGGGTVVTFTAAVSNGAAAPAGIVTFCDATATFCEGSAIIGTAQLTSSGKAVIKLVLGIGSYSYKAVFPGPNELNLNRGTLPGEH
jgi:hypothetical protein